MWDKKLPDLFLDTCVLHENFDLASQSWNVIERILKYKQYANCKVFVPEMVVWELVNQYKEEMLKNWWYEDTIRAINDRIKKINKFYYNSVPLSEISTPPEITELVEWYDSFFRRKLLSYGFEIIPNPSNSVFEKIIKKAIERKKPFEKDSDKWFKDALIWESYLKLLNTNEWEITLISDNHNDYWNKEKNNFHEDLLFELWTLQWSYSSSIDETRSKHFRDIEAHISHDMIMANIPKDKLIISLENNLSNYVPLEAERNFNECIVYWTELIGNINIGEIRSIYITSRSELLTKLKVIVKISIDYKIQISWTRTNAKIINSLQTCNGEIAINLELNNKSWEIKRVDESESLWINPIEDENIAGYENTTEHESTIRNKHIILNQYLWLNLFGIELSKVSYDSLSELEEDRMNCEYLSKLKS